MLCLHARRANNTDQGQEDSSCGMRCLQLRRRRLSRCAASAVAATPSVASVRGSSSSRTALAPSMAAQWFVRPV